MCLCNCAQHRYTEQINESQKNRLKAGYIFLFDAIITITGCQRRKFVIMVVCTLKC